MQITCTINFAGIKLNRGPVHVAQDTTIWPGPLKISRHSSNPASYWTLESFLCKVSFWAPTIFAVLLILLLYRAQLAIAAKILSFVPDVVSSFVRQQTNKLSQSVMKKKGEMIRWASLEERRFVCRPILFIIPTLYNTKSVFLVIYYM